MFVTVVLKKTNLSLAFGVLNSDDDPMPAGAGTCVTFTPIYPSLVLGVPGAVVFCGEVQPAIANETSKRTVVAAIGFRRIMLTLGASTGLARSKDLSLGH